MTTSTRWRMLVGTAILILLGAGILGAFLGVTMLWNSLNLMTDRARTAEAQWQRFANCYVAGGAPVFRLAATARDLDMVIIRCDAKASAL